MRYEEELHAEILQDIDAENNYDYCEDDVAVAMLNEVFTF